MATKMEFFSTFLESYSIPERSASDILPVTWIVLILFNNSSKKESERFGQLYVLEGKGIVEIGDEAVKNGATATHI